MKKISLFVVAVLAFSTVFGANLIKNGDFSKVNADGTPADWTVWPKKLAKGVKVEVDKNTGHNDDQSVAITNPEKKYYTRIDQLKIPCKPNTKYVLRAYIKGMNLEHSKKCGSARIFLGADGDVNKTVALTGPGTVRAKLKAADPWSFDWTKYEVTVNSRKNKELGLTIYLHFTKGTIWIDDVELIEVK